MGPQESALLRRFGTGGDAEAFAQMVQLYAGLVYSTCWRVLKDETDAADATQETFFELTRCANRITGSLAGWLHKVATQKSIDLLRRCASRKHREEAYARTQPVEVNSWQDLSGHVDQALDELDDATRSLLLERFVLGKSMVLIAREYGTSQATVSRRISAGLTQLRGTLRRKGVLVAAGALATILMESASQAASTTALHGLGKMAMVGTTEAAVTTAKVGLAKVLVAASVAAVVSAGAYMHLGRSASPAATTPVRVNPVSPASGDAPLPGLDHMAIAVDPAEKAGEPASEQVPPTAERSWTSEPGVNPFGVLADHRPFGAAMGGAIRQSEGTRPDRPPTPARTLRFPNEQSIGVVYLQDEDLVVPETVKGFHPGHVYAEMENHSCARGEVHIPAGKRVTLCIRGIGVTPQRYLAAIESLGPNDLYGLQFFSLQPVHIEDDLIAPVARLTGLRHLGLASVSVSPKGLSSLAQLPHVEQLTAPEGLTDQGMAQIAKMSSLRILHVARDRLTDEGLRSLSKLTGLESLDLYGNLSMTDDGLRALTNLHGLRHLRLGMEGPFTDRSMTYLAALPSLKVLWLDTHNVTDEGLRQLSQSRSLERLCIHWLEKITGRGVECLRAMPQLKALDITSAAFTEADLAGITSMPNLEHVVLPHCAFSDAAIGQLGSLDHLRYLWVNCSDNSPLTDKSLLAVSRMQELEELYIGGTEFTNEGIALLRNLNHLRALHLAFWRGLDDDTLKLMARFRTLRELSWSSSDHVTLSGLGALNDLVGLAHLSADNVRQDHKGLDLSRLKNLTSLRITLRRQTRKVGDGFVTTSDVFHDSDLACLSGLTGLETLSLCGRGIGDEGMAHLAPLTRVKYLDIEGSAELTDEGLKALAGMHRLDCLRIYQSRISERGLEALYPLKTIHILDIRSTLPIDAQAIARLRTELPHLQSLNIGRPESANVRARGQAMSERPIRRQAAGNARRW
ncbi:MAG: sigma-70 family RNA polymerase sigma factor [Sedimentisphaerales bacterium]|nr:sigma-70 family RNA polymerase sigma factor [Sedimentisphaerales bacterium]HNY80638.1 sigma-70 family RNA polymerase sigma factor [Sedimentisphaerales bacterium]HOC62942.1 sigma-70 family RNA polymerase sigma factor [Sedimentisphaerales bacterium]HOH66378.1 sigma-70 family RNA polymerase sigma factor [Sedimentisphaerales bacterium]HPY49971.1 sigma-70 family RNA polymerase sigma factor [Sedimentisphaerales bacterium]